MRQIDLGCKRLELSRALSQLSQELRFLRCFSFSKRRLHIIPKRVDYIW